MKLTAEILRSLIPLWFAVGNPPIISKRDLNPAERKLFEKKHLNPKNWKLQTRRLVKTEFKSVFRENIAFFKYDRNVNEPTFFYKNVFDAVKDYSRCVIWQFLIEVRQRGHNPTFAFITTPNDKEIITYSFFI